MVKGHRLGLHTEEEEAHALDLAAKTYDRGVAAAERRDPVAFEFSLGYLTAILDLAHAEGAHLLEEQVRGMIRRLRTY